ncbi:MAG TPA: hypothetical protein PKA91_14340, partial [Leptospiraceae bacterium]|nr:hypothetical protein [Leptospiraceae bacterium]
QSVTVILESEMKIHRIRIGKDVDHDVWDKSARELRTRIARSVHMRERGDDADLARVFRAMVPAPINRSTYVYLSSGFLLAPIYSEPGDRIFVVTDLERLARPAVPMDARFAGDFKVFIPGRKALESADSSDRTWDERAARMEELAVGISGSTPGISHLMNPLALSSRIEGAWFSSVPRHGDSALQTVVKYENDLIQALHSASAPGVFYAETGASEWAVRFIRFYYDRESGMTMVDRRYMDAQIRLRREGMGPLNVRLATPVLISD